MSFLQNLLRILDAQAATPTLFGWYHLMWLGIVILSTVLLCRLHRKKPNMQPWKVVFSVAVLVTVLEIYKQINYSFSYENGITFAYQWYAFPFQFCSTPMYIGLLAGLFRKGRISDALMAYLATFAVFAGVCVMVYPGDVFIGTVGVNIQTMICHGSMITVGVYLLYCGRVKLEHKTVLKGAAVFAACVSVAMIMNEVAKQTGLLETHTFNMFFISPYCEPSLPVYSLVQGVVPFPWCLLIYIAAFSLAAYLMLLMAMGIKAIFAKKQKTAV